MKTVYFYGKKHVSNLGGWSQNDRWSRDSTSTTWSVVGCGEDVPDDYIRFDSVDTDLTGTVFGVYAIYSTGDSFGNDKSANFEAVWVFDSLAMAEAAIDTIKAHAKWHHDLSNRWSQKKVVASANFVDEYTVLLNVGKGDPYRLHVPWNGYFERLEQVDYVTFKLTDTRATKCLDIAEMLERVYLESNSPSTTIP